MSKYRPYVLSLVGVYSICLPPATMLFLWWAQKSCYSYAYWGVLISTLLLPLTCLLSIIIIPLCVTFYSKQIEYPNEEFHLLFILGAIPTITIVTLAVSLLWQFMLKLLNKSLGIPPRFPILHKVKVCQYFVTYLITTAMGTAFLVVFAGKGYVWGIALVLPKAALFYALYHISAHYSHHIRTWTKAREFFYLGFSYICGSLVCFVIFHVLHDRLTYTERMVSFSIGVLGSGCILGLIFTLLTTIIGQIHHRCYCAGNWRRIFLYYIIFALITNFAFTYGADSNHYHYGFWLIIPVLILFSLPIIIPSENYNCLHHLNAFYGFIPVTAPFMFVAFWCWVKKYGVSEEGETENWTWEPFNHFLYITGVLFFSCLLSYGISIVWNEIAEWVTHKLSLYPIFQLSTKLQNYTSVSAYLGICYILQMAAISFTGNSKYLYGLGIGPMLTLIIILPVVLRNSNVLPRNIITLFDSLFGGYFLTMTFLSAVFFVVFCAKQYNNRKKTYYIEFSIGILGWIPMAMGLIFYVWVRQNFFKRFLVILSVMSMALTLTYLVNANYYPESPYDDTKESYNTSNSDNLLPIAGIVVFVPGILYFLLCSIWGKQSNRVHYHLDFGLGMRGLIATNLHSLCTQKFYYPALPLIIYSFILPMYFVCVLFQYCFLLLYCYLFQTLKLCVLPALAQAHLPFERDQKRRQNANFNVAIFLEGICFCIPELAILSLHNYANGSQHRTTTRSMIFFWLFVIIAIISILHSFFNLIFNIVVSRSFFASFGENPLLVRIFPIVAEEEIGHLHGPLVCPFNYNKLIKEIPIIPFRAKLPPSPIHAHTNRRIGGIWGQEEDIEESEVVEDLEENLKIGEVEIDLEGLIEEIKEEERENPISEALSTGANIPAPILNMNEINIDFSLINRRNELPSSNSRVESTSNDGNISNDSSSHRRNIIKVDLYDFDSHFKI